MEKQAGLENKNEDIPSKEKIVDYIKGNTTEFLAYLESKREEIGEMTDSDILVKAKDFAGEKIGTVKSGIKGGVKAAEGFYNDTKTNITDSIDKISHK